MACLKEIAPVSCLFTSQAGAPVDHVEDEEGEREDAAALAVDGSADGRTMLSRGFVTWAKARVLRPPGQSGPTL